MRPITFICALVATLQLSCSNSSATGGWTWPIRGPVLTPYRNGGDPYAAGQHRGIDIGAPVGSRVVAAVGGTVSFAGVVGSSGLTVSERTSDGRFDLSYLHLSSTSVHRGDVLVAGAPLGAVGVSGRRSVAAPHLHFGVRDAGARDAYRDPLGFLAPPPGDRAPRPVPAPVPVAHPAAPVHAHARRPAHRVRRAHPAVTTAPLPHTAPAALPGHVAHPRHSTAAATAPVPLHGPAAAATPARARAVKPLVRPATPHVAHGGVNIGWLVACLGLIAAATALGRPDATRKLAARGRSRLSGLLRPASRGG